MKEYKTGGRPIVARPNKNNLGHVNLFPVGSDTAKDLIYGRLKIEEPGPGFMHFPLGYDAEYFAQLTAEKVVVKYTRGFQTRVYVKARARNEALDCRIYAVAALAILNVDLDQLTKDMTADSGQPADESATRPRGWLRRGPWLKR